LPPFKFHFASTLAVFALAETHVPILIPLLCVCGIVIVAIPVAALRGKLHMPGYAGLALLSLVVGLVLGKISATASIKGTPAGIALSAIFFVLIAVTIGSVFALACYRQHEPPAADDSAQKPETKESAN
jgi:hypothetical protein